ncbi:MAG: DUF1653 domain-containing protein [Blautia sp.]|nr:DUF1653 domain-containing protein [Lachnoclostridium sp.]MCM1210100.1 DUF1653 domain-containing protein [Blautia sp.]
MRHNPQPQELYRHFKGSLYQVRCLARHSETGEQMVVYQAMYGDFQIYVRPLDSFMEEVDREKYPHAGQRYRFELRSAEQENRAVKESPDMELSEMTQQGKVQEGKLEERLTAFLESKPELQQAKVPMDKPDGVSQYEAQEELNIDPLVLQFLDADSYEQRLEILAMLHNRIDNEMINTMAVAVDVEIKEGEIEDRYEELKNCLLTFAKYESSRLR